MGSLSVLTSVIHQAAGGASRPETELGSRFLKNTEQELRFYSSHVLYELRISAAKCTKKCYTTLHSLTNKTVC